MQPHFDDDVPAPEPVKVYRNGEYSPYRVTIMTMKVGQSFLAYGRRDLQRYMNAVRPEKKQGKQYTSRKVSEGTWRIWRVK